MRIKRKQLRSLIESALKESRGTTITTGKIIQLPSAAPSEIFGKIYTLQNFENGGKLILKRTQLSGEKWSITSKDDFEISSLGDLLLKWKNKAHGIIDYPHYRVDGETISSQGHSSVLEIKTSKPEQEIRIQTSGGL